MQNLGQREKILIIVTTVFIVLFAGWRMGAEDLVDRLFSGNSDVQSREKKFLENLGEMEGLYTVEKAFSRVGEFPSADGTVLKPALAFTQHVSKMCSDLGFQFPPIRPETEPIDGVDEYELINVAIKTEGSFPDTVKLLKAFEEDGLIFREVDLQASRDKPIVTARVTVARIAKKPEKPSRFRGVTRQ